MGHLAYRGLALAFCCIGVTAARGGGHPQPTEMDIGRFFDPRIAHGGPPARTIGAHGAGNCVTPAQRERVDAAVRSYMQDIGPTARSRPSYPFVPLGGTLYADLLPPGYVDHDPTAGFIDYACGSFTYDTHAGIDIGLRSFDEQAIGVPVFAALGGIVAYAHDGEPDMNTCLCGQTSNLVVIDHGGGRFGEYWHLKNGSITVTVGQGVSAGQVVGLAASSGNSAGPHLHFETRDQPGNVVFDPFIGPCGGAEPGWVDQPPYALETYVADFGYMTVEPWLYDGYPHRFPTTQQMGFDEYLWWWMQIVNLPPHSTFREIYVRPNGTISFDSGDLDFENPEFYRVSNYWFYHFYLPEMRTIAGEWRIQMLINGELVSDTPIIVGPATDPDLNRPPEPVGVSFDPASPSASDVLFARIDGDLVLDDLDYDLVRYRYVWRVNDDVVRDQVWAGRADALPAGALEPGDVVHITVTPNDGKADGPSASTTLTISGGCTADYNKDGFGDILDFLDFLSDYASCDGDGVPCGKLGNPDLNGDGLIDILDFLDFLQAFSAGC